MHGVALSGERAGKRDVRVGGGSRNEPFVKGPLCADFDGFSLHGAVRVAAGDRKRLEHLCRCALQPRARIHHDLLLEPRANGT